MNASPPTDESLLKLVALGDEEAFAVVYQRMAPRVMGLLRTILADRAEAEDVLQEILWEVWRRAAAFKPEIASASTWILMTARARGIDRLRKRGRSLPATSIAPLRPFRRQLSAKVRKLIRCL